MDGVYVSCIKINGRPILPPVIFDENEREELRNYRDLALQIELKIRERSLNLAVDVVAEDLTLPVVDEELAVSAAENLAVSVPDLTESSHYPHSPDPTDSTDLNLDLDTSSEATLGRGLVRSASYTLETPCQALLDSIIESEASEASTIKDRKRSSIPKFTCSRKKSVKVATVYSPRRRKSVSMKKPKIVEIADDSGEDDDVATVVEADLMDNMIKSMRDEYELQLEMLRKQQEEEKAKLREEFLSQQHSLFARLAINPTERSQSPPIKPDKTTAVVVSKNLSVLTATMSKLPLAALVRGYFVRRLHRTERVENIKSAIKETLCLAINLHEQPPPLSIADIELHGRLIQQLDQSLLELHSVFFELPCQEQLRIIATDRERSMRGSFSSRSSNSGRISSATERRQEMRRRSQQENLTPRGRLDSKGRRPRRLSRSPSKSILTESSRFDGGNMHLSKSAVPWR